MPGLLYDYLCRDHSRLDDLLRRARAFPGVVDLPTFELFRGGLLRHIGMEEKILLPEARRLRGGEPLALAKPLRADHAALAALLVPTPTPAIVATIREVLEEHNPLEEGPGGIYEICETLAGPDVDALVARLERAPEVPLAPHFDGERAFAAIERLLRARGAGG